MSDKEFKDKLLKILEEGDQMVLEYFKKMILNILPTKDSEQDNSIIKKLEIENKNLQSEVDSLQKKYLKNEEKLLLLLKEISEKNIQIEKMELNLKEKDSEIKFRENRFKIEEELFKEYNSIIGSLKDELKGVFKGNTIEEFIYCGVQPKNIDSLWEIAKKSILEDEKDWDKVVKLFKYFFDSFNKTYNSPIYISLNTRIDDKFEPDLHLSKNIASGYIEKIYLEGYADRNEKIIKKAIVSLN